MADINLAVQTVVQTGLAPVYTSSLSISDVYIFPNDGAKVWIHAKKTGAGPCNLTLVTPGTVQGLAVADRVVVVPATTGDVMIFAGPGSAYVSAGRSSFTVSEVTGLSVAVLKVP